MLVQQMSCYFLYSVPMTDDLAIPAGADNPVGVSSEIIERLKQRFQLSLADIPAFYTKHYREEHTPYLLTEPKIPGTFIPAGRLNDIDFFKPLNLSQPIALSWEFMLSLQTIGLITLRLDVQEPLPSHLAYRLSGLHLNPAYSVIDTEPVKALWESDPASRPEHITLDQLARRIHKYFFEGVGLRAVRIQSLRHETQIPFTAYRIETHHNRQSVLIQEEAASLAELVFKPACWEVEETSSLHADRILAADRLWSVAKDAFVVTAYEGNIYVQINPFATGVTNTVSGSWLAEEEIVFFTFKIAVSNYHFLRTIDFLLDKEMSLLRHNTGRYHHTLNQLFQTPHIALDSHILQEMNESIIRFSRLRFQIIDLLEEVENSDKLIDEEWHIILLEKFNGALGTKVWFNSVRGRINNAYNLIHTLENSYERLVEVLNNLQNQAISDRLNLAQVIFGALAIVELLGLLIDVAFDDNNPLVSQIQNSLDLGILLAHGLAVLGVIGIILSFMVLLRGWVQKQVDHR